jgi:hypothetical protein
VTPLATKSRQLASIMAWPDSGPGDALFQEAMLRLEMTSRQLTTKEQEISKLAARNSILEKELARCKEETAAARCVCVPASNVAHTRPRQDLTKLHHASIAERSSSTRRWSGLCCLNG